DQSGEPQPFSLSGPLQAMRNATVTPLHGCQPRHFSHQGETFALWLSGDGELWQGLEADNPAIGDLSYLVLRNHLPQARFVCVWDLAKQSPLTEVCVHHTAVGTQLTVWRGERVAHVTLYDDPALRPEFVGRD
ncbi:TPA: alginate lyase, partial [Kluyvera ascorbata]|nr:alginate lyase [Kluyvera ascorbata]